MLNLKAKAKLPTENPLATNIYFDNSYSKEARKRYKTHRNEKKCML